MAWDPVGSPVAQPAGGTNNDLTYNIGTGVGRKAVLFIGALDDGAETPSTAVYDPAGTNVPMSLIRNEGILNSGDAFYMLDAFYYDIPDGQSGSKVFRGIQTGGFGSVAVLQVYANCPAGAPEASDFFESAEPATSSSDDLTTVSDGAKILSAVFGQGGAASPFFTATGGQTKIADVDQDDYLNLAVGERTGSTAGVHTLSWSHASAEIQLQIDVAWPMSGGGGGGDESKSGSDSFTFSEAASVDTGATDKVASDEFSFDEGAEALTDLTFEDWQFNETAALAAALAPTEELAFDETAALGAGMDLTESFSFLESASVSTSGGDSMLGGTDSFAFTESAVVTLPPGVGTLMIGTESVISAKKGSANITRVYQGSTLVWEAGA